MPLPRENQKWPPELWEPIYNIYAEHAAWYSGDPNQLAKVFSAQIYTPTPKGRHWAKDVQEEKRTMLHIPLAGDIASTSADLLFSEHPKIKIAEAHGEKNNSGAKTTQKRLDNIINLGNVYNRILEAADTCSAMSGVFIKPVWDQEIADYPILSVAQADNALPEFKFGILTAVTLWKVLEEDGHIVWRLVERHEKGAILNGLYKGSHTDLGVRVSLQSREDTAVIEDVVDTGIDDLAIRYVPNMRPNRRFRGSSLGQSDYSGVEGLMDALDEVWSSWIRDIRIGKGRVIVPESFLEKGEDGSFAFDVDREIFTALDMDPMTAKDAGFTINQFDIRTEQHQKTALELIDRIVGSAGYSPQSFGLKIEGRAESGTALNVRERKSFITAAKKAEYWQPAIRDVLRMMLQIDRVHLGNRTEVFEPVVEIQDSVETDELKVAQSVEMLNRAQAISVETKVRMVHPDWEKEQVDSEVKRIMEEQGLAVESDPMQVGIS